MPEQLMIDGGSVPYPLPPPRHLTERQRELLRYMRGRGTIVVFEAFRFYADPWGALRRLADLGLVERAEPRTGASHWRAT